MKDSKPVIINVVSKAAAVEVGVDESRWSMPTGLAS
jgi:hypothetical protein